MTDTLPVPPQNREAEESVLGAILLSQTALTEVTDVLHAGDFYFRSFGRIFDAASRLDATGIPVDAITVVDELERRGELEECGGRVRIHELAALVPATANAAHYARIVKETATLRGLVRTGQELIRLGVERPGDVENLLDQAQQAVFSLTESSPRDGLVPLRDSLFEQFDRIRELNEIGGGLAGVSSGLASLDALTGGFEPGNLIVVGARPSLGKSALALGFARHLTVREELPVALYSLEMSRAEVTQRLLSAEAAVPLTRIRRGDVRADEWTRLSRASDVLSRAPLGVDEDGTASAARVRSSLRRLRVQQPKLALAIVDYLQLMGVERGRGERRDLELGDTTRALKQAARQVGVPLVLLSQLNRESERRADRRPTLADLRDSGAIEADADIVILLHRSEENVVAIVAKNRNGPTGDVALAWHGETTRFADMGPGA